MESNLVNSTAGRFSIKTGLPLYNGRPDPQFAEADIAVQHAAIGDASQVETGGQRLGEIQGVDIDVHQRLIVHR